MYIKPPHWDLLVIGGDIAEMYASGVSHKLSTSVACHVKSSWMMAFSLNFLLAKAKNHARVVSSKTARFAKGRSASGRSCMIARPKVKEVNKQSPLCGVSILSTLDIWILAKRPPIMPPGAGVSSNPLACRAFRRMRNSLSDIGASKGHSDVLWCPCIWHASQNALPKDFSPTFNLVPPGVGVEHHLSQHYLDRHHSKQAHMNLPK